MIEVKDLLSLGYRRLVEGKNKFAKPFAFSVYIFDLDDSQISQHFRSASDGTLLCWSTKKCVTLIDVMEYEL